MESTPIGNTPPEEHLPIVSIEEYEAWLDSGDTREWLESIQSYMNMIEQNGTELAKTLSSQSAQNAVKTSTKRNKQRRQNKNCTECARQKKSCKPSSDDPRKCEMCVKRGTECVHPLRRVRNSGQKAS